MKCVIPCAGESSRMSGIPKQLIRINDKPMLQYVIDLWKEYVDSFVFVVKRSILFLPLLEHLPENSIVVFQDEPKGLADAVLRAEKCIYGRFVVTLGDCLFKGEFDYGNFEQGIGVWRTTNLAEINKSYHVEVDLNKMVKHVLEKPNLAQATTLQYCGMGTYFFDKRVFDYIRNYKGQVGGGDLTAVIQDMINAGERISPIMFKGEYINVGSPEDIKKAEEVLK